MQAKTIAMSLVFMLSSFCTTAAFGEPDRSNITIRIGTQPGLTTTTLVEESQWLEERGYNVEWISFNSAGSELRALASDSLDIAMAGASPGFVLCSRYPGCKFIAAPITNGVQLIVPPDSDIKTVEDLKGKNIAYPGPGSQQYALLSTALNAAGMVPEDVGLYKTAAPAMSSQLLQGEVDGFMAWTPFTSEPARKGQGRVVISGQKVFEEVGGEGQWISEGYFARRAFVEEHPDVVVEVLEDVARAAELVRTDLDKAASLWSGGTELPEEAFTYAVSEGFAVFPESIVPNVQTVESMISILKDAGLMDEDLNVKEYSADLVDASYAERAESNR